MEENLAGYLIGALDPETERAVERYLQNHPHSRPRLEQLRRVVERLAGDKEPDPPPPDLRARTLARVAEFRCRTLPQAPAPTQAQRTGGRSSWRRVNVVAAACLLLFLTGLGVVGVKRAWNVNNQASCQDNLRKFYLALTSYADDHDGQFPKVDEQPPHNIAGVFVLMVPDTGFTVNCPANGQRGRSQMTLAEFDAMRMERPEDFESLARGLSGCYAYTLGYCEPVDGRECHFGLRMDSGTETPILADRPPYGEDLTVLAGNSYNHGRKGQNVLFVGGQVRFCTEPIVAGDDIYHNRAYRVAAGLNRFDTVLGQSNACPYPPEEP
jgi:hypothetical protein